MSGRFKFLSHRYASGEDYSKIARRIERATEFARRKARDVARTEAHRVQVSARMKSAEKQNGAILKDVECYP